MVHYPSRPFLFYGHELYPQITWLVVQLVCWVLMIMIFAWHMIERVKKTEETFCWLTRVDAIKLFLNNLLCGGQHQITNIEDLHSGHGVLIYLYFRFSPVYCNRMTPQLNPPWEVIEKTISVARLLSLIHLVKAMN